MSRVVVLSIILLLAGLSPSVEDIKSEVAAVTEGNFAAAIKSLDDAIAKAQAEVPEPERLIIPAIKVNAPILPMGVTKDGKMAVPDDYVNVGWYATGTRPGDKGSAVMGAHVDNGSNTQGVFKRLRQLKKGDIIKVQENDGTIITFKITGAKVYNYRTPVTQDIFLANDKARLNLITCHGTWLPKENTYNKRLVIFSERM